jgi:hypothetical protein
MTGASRRHSGDRTTGAATLYSRTQGRREYTATPATASAGGCSRRPALPRGPFSPSSVKQKAPRRRNESTSPNGGRSPSILHTPLQRWRLRDGVGAEVVQLHPVVMQDRPHEAVCRHTESPLVEGDEAHDVPRRWGRGGSVRGGGESTPAASHQREGEVNPQQRGPLGHPP